MLTISLEPRVSAVPRRPHMPEEAIAWLERRLPETKCFLEFGPGGSTIMAAELGVPTIVSIESDEAFAKIMRKEMRAFPKTKAHVIFSDLGQTELWGFPATKDNVRTWPHYSLSVWTFMARKKLVPDLVLIDGRFRVACWAASMLYAETGTTIMFDDYVSKKFGYEVVENAIKPDRLIDRCAIFTVPKKRPLRELAMMLGYYVVRPR